MPIRCRFLWRGGTERSFSFVFYRMQSSYNVCCASGDHFYHLGPAEWISDRVYQRIGEVILGGMRGRKVIMGVQTGRWGLTKTPCLVSQHVSQPSLTS